MFKKLFFLLFLASFPVVTQAQYTEVINSNYPGFSQSPYSVGKDVYQLESNFFYRDAEPIVKFDNPSSYGVNIHFRTTFMFERLELNAQTALQNDKLSFKNVFTTSRNKFGLGQLTLGAKYLLYVPEYEDKTKQVRSWKERHGFDLRRLIPHVALYAGGNFGSVLGEYHKKGGISPKVGLLLQHELDLRTNVVTNVYYNYIGSDFAEWEYILTGTYVLSGRWSGFLEHQATFNKHERKSNVGGGLAYLFTRDLQVNCSARATFQESGLGSYFSLGASYRIDRHEDDFIELDDFGNKVEEQEGVKKEGFFKRIWGSIKGIFKKKEKVAIESKNENGQIEKEEVEVETSTGRKRKKSVLGGVVRKDQKAKKKKKRAETKAEKEAERKAEKAKKKERKEEEKNRLKRIKELKEDLKAVKKQQEEFFGEGNIPSNKTDKEKAIEQEIELIQKEMEEDKTFYEEEEKLAKEEEALRKEEERLLKEQEKIKKEKEKSDSKTEEPKDKTEKKEEDGETKPKKEEKDFDENKKSPWDR